MLSMIGSRVICARACAAAQTPTSNNWAHVGATNQHAQQAARSVAIHYDGRMHTVSSEPEPGILYGTAWKEQRTEALVRLALTAGFRAIDTANQRKHYVESAVGAALRSAAVPRTQLFLQTKFTYARGQDQRLPCDPDAPLAEQVRQSFA